MSIFARFSSLCLHETSPTFSVVVLSSPTKAGLTARGPLDAGYHDAKRSFLLGHGQAARENLESGVACHAERDCLTCHSALGGPRFNPHAPGFDPETLRRKNSQVCIVCYGPLIPRSPGN